LWSGPLIPKIVEAFGKKRAYTSAGALTVLGGLGIALSPPSVLAWPLISFAVHGIGSPRAPWTPSGITGDSGDGNQR
jgi:Na+/melibiose symporter-like transporter